MNISIFVICCLIVLIIVNVYRTFIIEQHQYIEVNCVQGTDDNEQKNIVECVGCMNFQLPLKSQSYGYFVVDNKPLTRKQQQITSQQSLLMLGVWMQQGCNDYQCSSFLENEGLMFDSPTISLRNAEFQQHIHNFNKIYVTSDFWKTSKIKYSNLKLPSDSVINPINLIQRIFHRILSPFNLFNSSQYYYSMAIRFNYMMPNNDKSQSYHPLIRVYPQQQHYETYILLSFLIVFVLYFKKNHNYSHTQQNQRPNFKQLLMGFGFLIPQIISIISIVMMGCRDGKFRNWHYLSLLFYLCYIGTDAMPLLAISAKISLFSEYKSQKQTNTQISKFVIASFIIILIISHYLIAEYSLLMLCPALIYALTYQQKNSQNNHIYMPVKKSKQMIQLEEIQEVD